MTKAELMEALQYLPDDEEVIVMNDEGSRRFYPLVRTLHGSSGWTRSGAMVELKRGFVLVVGGEIKERDYSVSLNRYSSLNTERQEAGD